MTVRRTGTTSVALGPDDLPPKELLRLQRLARELRLTDQILSTDLDAVTVELGGPAPAWTTLEGDKVSFAFNKMPKLNGPVDVAVWLGTNAHELGHVLHSPRRDSVLMYRVLQSERTFLHGIAAMHNIVEDQRQERLILARFSPWRGYLVAALSHHIKADNDSAWLLLAGRTWLPSEVRATAKAMFVQRFGQAMTDEVTHLVGEYQHLLDPGDTEADEAWDILQKLQAMFADELPDFPVTCTVIKGGEPDTDDPGDGDDVPMTADEADDLDDDDEADDSDADSDEADDGKSDGHGKGESESERPKSSSGAGDKKGAKDKNLRKQLKEAARQIITEDEEAADDLDSVMDALDNGRGGDEAEGADKEGAFVNATAKAQVLRRDVADALLDLKDENEPGWLRRTDSGRLNVRRLVSGESFDPETVFDRYEPGMMDASELDVVVLLDVSGSMSSQVFDLAEATWAIRHAVDDMEGNITVITFDTGPHRILASPGERPDGRMFVPQPGGGTEPTSALAEAYRLLAGSQAKNRLMMVLTDGDWFGNGRKDDDLIDAMNAEKITTVIAWLGMTRQNLHRCTFGATIDEPQGLARLFRTVAADRIRSWM